MPRSPERAGRDSCGPGKLDVVIPVWNEAPWLDRLLPRMRSSSCVASIIVADNESTDGSPGIALRHGCILVRGGRPATARNQGARSARAPIILFLDADTIIPDPSMRAALSAFADDRVSAVHFRTVPLSDSRWVKGVYVVTRLWIGALDRCGISQGIGTAIAVRQPIFHRIRGFREDVAVGEDAVFLRDAAATGRVVYLRDYPVYTSARRLRVEGWLVFPLKVAVWALLRLCKASASLMPYRWCVHDHSVARAEDEIIARLEL